jgi:uncharacterized protein
MTTALITGGTSGIGAEFAKSYARRGYSLVLVARDASRLESTASELRALGAPTVETLSADLADRAQVARVANRIEDADAPIDILVNNAGFGFHIRLATSNVEPLDTAFDVMCRAVLVLSGAAARAMKTRGTGQIINISSTAAFITTGAYSAIKVWVLNYTEGLANELRGSGVTALAVCPGWVRTEFHERAGINAGSIPNFLWVDAASTVESAIRASERGRVIVVPSVRYSLLMWVVRHLPRVTVRWVSRAISSSRDEPPTAPNGALSSNAASSSAPAHEAGTR